MNVSDHMECIDRSPVFGDFNALTVMKKSIAASLNSHLRTELTGNPSYREVAAWYFKAARLCEELAYIHNQMYMCRQDRLRERFMHHAVARSRKPLTDSEIRFAENNSAAHMATDKMLKDLSGGNAMFVQWATMYASLAQTAINLYSMRG